MGSSFIKYNKYGFWSSDTDIEVWLYLLALEVDKSDDKSEWLLEARENWLFYATSGITGAIDASLDDIIDSEEKRNKITKLSYLALNTLRQYGDTIPLGIINEWGVGGGNNLFTRAPDTTDFIFTGNRFVNILNSENKWAKYLKNEMGECYVKFGNSGFWTTDPELEIWLYLMVTEIEEISPKPTWLSDAKDYWLRTLKSGFLGSMKVALDDIADSPTKRNQILEIAIRARERLLSYGDCIPASFLQAGGVGGGNRVYIDPIPIAWLFNVADQFIELLKSPK